MFLFRFKKKLSSMPHLIWSSAWVQFSVIYSVHFGYNIVFGPLMHKGSPVLQIRSNRDNLGIISHISP